jgi:hypothetical protein
MKLELIDATRDDYHLKIDVLELITTILVLLLTINHVIPLWALVLYCLKGFSGLSVKLKFVK